MGKITNFFAGANSGGGFQNLFSQIVDVETARDFIILKGGPGVGKNTFMREIGRTMEEAGLDVEYLWCSGDPNSLDGVILPQIGCAVADGTSPHVLEPHYPAAVDRYVNLGQFYDLTAAKASAKEVRAHTKAYQSAYVKAYRSLRAAREIEKTRMAEAAATFESQRAWKRLRGIMSRELRRRGGEGGRTHYRFLGSITHRGYIWRMDSVETLCPKVYALCDNAELAAPFFKELWKSAVSLGWNTVCCMNPEEPEQIEHLLIPGLGLGFVTSRPGMEGPQKPFRRIRLDAMTSCKNRSLTKFQERMCGLLREDAVESLKEAKASHDALEAVYNPYVDFEGVHTLAALEAGRMLSYLE